MGGREKGMTGLKRRRIHVEDEEKREEEEEEEEIRNDVCC